MEGFDMTARSRWLLFIGLVIVACGPVDVDVKSGDGPMVGPILYDGRVDPPNPEYPDPEWFGFWFWSHRLPFPVDLSGDEYPNNKLPRE
jgi:hypothetical protein